MNPKAVFSRSCDALRFVLSVLVVLGLMAASVATVSADSQEKGMVIQEKNYAAQKKTRYVRKYVKVVGSNIPVPVWAAEGRLPQTTVPIRSYTAEEWSKMGAQTPAQGLANDPSVFITGH